MSLQDLQTAITNFDPTVSNDDFLNQLLSGLQTTVSWPDPSFSDAAGNPQNNHFDHHSTNFLSSKLRNHHITTAGESTLFQNDDVPSFKSPMGENNTSVQNMFHEFTGSLNMQNQNFGSPAMVMGQAPTGAAAANGGGGGGAPSQPRPRVRARRGQATDPHSIAERLRRERIAERMKALQELVPNANKADKATMLDDIIDYVKFLQLQVKVLSMSRLGGVSSATTATEAGADDGGLASSSNNETTENQVVKLMEEDMGSAMQYLQSKGLCLMPISLATAMSTTRCHPSGSRNFGGGEGGGPCSPNVSVLTVQSANGVPVKDSP